MKKNIICTLGLFVFIFLTDYGFHSGIMDSMYKDTAELWRPESVMQEFFSWLVLGQLILAIALTQIFQRVNDQTVVGMMKFGVLLGVLYGSNQIIMYAVAPYTPQLVVMWITGAIIQYALIAVLYAWINEKITD